MNPPHCTSDCRNSSRPLIFLEEVQKSAKHEVRLVDVSGAYQQNRFAAYNVRSRRLARSSSSPLS
jgi:hypothetical protein